MRIFAALLALLTSACLALAQPAPVPGLPDAPRLTTVTLNNSVGPVSVPFAIYGDGSDYGNWVEVFVNNVYQTPVTQWTLSSPSGSLTGIARPITNAQITFATPQTGTVVVVGARRPRRVSQFAENKGVPARDLNVALTDLVSQNRETWDKLNDLSGRALLGLPGEAISLMPPATQRAGGVLGFDSTGNKPIMFSPGGGPPTPTLVTSVFGRIGNVVATANDYNFSQIGGNVALTQMAPISANNVYGNLGSGAVAVPVPPCGGAGNALTWAAGVGFGCNSISGVSSWNTRTGAVLPAANDYSFAQISGLVGFTQFPTIPANAVYGNLGAGASGLPVPSCSGASQALAYTLGTGFSCVTVTGGAFPGTLGQLAWYAATGSAVSGNPNFTINGSDATLGVQGSAVGTLSFANATTGRIKLLPPTGALGISDLTLPARSANVATTFGTTISGNCARFDANGNIVDAGGACTTGGGGGTVASGTAGQSAYYGSTGTTVSGNPNVTISGGTITLGQAGTTSGAVVFVNTTSGGITVQPPPTGAMGNPVLTWPTRTGTVATTTGTLTSGGCANFDASGNLITGGSPCSSAAVAPPANAIQFNSSGALGGDAKFTWVSPKLTINNNAAALTAPPTGTLFQMGGADSANVYFDLDVYGNGAGVTPAFAGRHYGGTGASPAATGSGETLFNLGGYAHDGTASAQGGTFAIITSQLWASGAHGTRVSVFTTPDNSTTRTEALRVNSSGGLAIGSPYTDPGTGGLFVAGTSTFTGTAGFAAANFSGNANFTGTFQVAGNTMTFPGAAATLSQKVTNGTAALGTAAIASGACATAVTVAAAGVATTDVIQAGFNGDPTGVVGYQPTANGMLSIIPYPTAGNVNFKVCNNTAASITPGAITLNWRVAR